MPYTSNARPPSHLMSAFQEANVGRVVTGHSGIIPYNKPPAGAPLAPSRQAPQTDPAIVRNRGIIPGK